MKTLKTTSRPRVLFLAVSCLLVMQCYTVTAQNEAYNKTLAPYLQKLDNAHSVTDYQSLANDFARIAGAYPKEWLGYYYAAYCNTRIGWLYQGKGDKIEPYAQLASTQIQQAASLAGSDNKVLADIYCVWSMAQRAYVFINPMSYGPKYGPVSAQYLEKAKKADPDNPRVLWLEGWVKYYTPKLWGGDKDKAKTFLQQALDKLKSPVMTPSFPHWGRNDCESLLAQYKS